MFFCLLSLVLFSAITIDNQEARAVENPSAAEMQRVLPASILDAEPKGDEYLPDQSGGQLSRIYGPADQTGLDTTSNQIVIFIRVSPIDPQGYEEELIRSGQPFKRYNNIPVRITLERPGDNIRGYFYILGFEFSIHCRGRYAQWEYFDGAVTSLLANTSGAN